MLPHVPQVMDHTPEADHRALTGLGRWAMRFTPRVAVQGDDGLLLDVAGSARLFGGLVPLARQVRQRLTRLGFETRVAVAPTVGLAWGLARFGDEGVHDDTGTLAGLPVAALWIDAEIVEALAELGVDRVGQLLDIPRHEIARRFGDDVLLRLDQMQGDAVEPMTWLPFIEVPRVACRFTGPATQYEAIEQTTRDLVDSLCDELARLESATRRVVLEIERLDGDLRPAFDTMPVTFSHPTRDARHLWAVLRPVVESLDMGRGVDALALKATGTTRLPHGQSRLDGERDASRDEQDLGRLIDLLQGRLGRENVFRLEPTPSHVPEAAFRYVPADEQIRTTSPDGTHTGDRPTVLLDPPEPAEVSLMNPEGPLVSLRWRSRSLGVLTTVGPERIGRRWWKASPSDKTLDVRDYYKLQLEDGLWVWVYRLLSDTRRGRWFVHGIWS